MNRKAWTSILGCGVLLALLIAAARHAWSGQDGGPYSVAALQAALAHDPAAVVGRAIRVRGTVPLPLIFESCGAAPRGGCAGDRPAYLLYPADQPAGIRGKRSTLEFDYEAPTGSTMPLIAGPGDSLLAALRRLPLLGGLAPPRQRLRFGAPATYSVQVQPAPAHSLLCLRSPCWLLVLIDPAPDSL